MKIITKSDSYKLLPFRFKRINGKTIILVSETGEFCFVDDETIHDLLDKKLNKKSKIYTELKLKHFLYEDNYNPILEMAAQYKSKKSFLIDGPALHVFVVTLRCNHTCQYCQVSRAPLSSNHHDMSEERCFSR